MHIRPARAEDASDMATIVANCNETDSLSRYITRDIFKYYTSYRFGCLRFIKSKMIEKGNVTFVVETDPEDHRHIPDSDNIEHSLTPRFEFGEGFENGGLVIGFAIWNRFGKSENAQKWLNQLNADWASKLERGLSKVEDRYFKLFPTVERTLNHAHLAEFLNSGRMNWDRDIFPEAWELAVLSVHPNWQKRGVAKMLLKFGFERGQEEMVPVLIKGSPIGGVVYRKAGFKSVEYLDLGQLFDELQYGGEKMQGWVWEPDPIIEAGEATNKFANSESSWVERARKKNNWKDLSTPPQDRVLDEIVAG